MGVAARRFGEVRTEDLGRLPARVVAGLLGDDGLAAGSEDEVHRPRWRECVFWTKNKWTI